MARVLFYTGLSLLAVSATLLYLPTYFSIIIALSVLILLTLRIILYKKIKVYGLTLLLCVVLIFTLLGIHTQLFKIKPTEPLVGYDAEIIGTVSEFPTVYDNYTVYIIETEQIKLKITDETAQPIRVPQNLKLRLTDVNKIGAKVFDKLRLNVSFKDLDIYKTSSYANKIYAGGHILSLEEHLGQNRPFYAIFYDLKESINDLLFENMHYEDAAVISAVLLGDKTHLDRDFENNSRLAGTTHMLVVSGMHLGIIFQILSKIFRKLKIRRGAAEVLMLFAIFALTAVCGFTPSVLRASLTYVIIVIGNLLFRKPDPLNSLGIATIILLFINPLGFGNLSLLLSLLSTFGLLFICPILQQSIMDIIAKIYTPKRITKALVFSFSQTLSAILATMPVCILGIGYISLISPLANLLTGYASTLLTSFAFLAVILLCMPNLFKPLALLPIFILYALVRFIVKATDLCASLDFAAVPALNEYLIPLFLIILIIPLLMLAKKYSAKNRTRISLKISACILVLVSISSTLFFYTASPKWEIAIPNVGKGCCVLLKSEKQILAIGAGDSPSDYHKIETEIFKMCHRDIDYIILPSDNKQFAAGAPEMAFNNPNSKVIFPEGHNYSNKLSYISNQNFTRFEDTATVSMPEAEIISKAHIGCTVNFKDFSLVIYSGNGDVNLLFNNAKHKNPIFICSNNLKQKLNHTISRCIVIGSDEAKSSAAKVLNSQHIKYELLGEKTITIKF